MGITHWFSIENARDDLGYEPSIQNDMTEAVQWFIDRGYSRKKSQNSIIEGYTNTRFFKDILLAFLFGALIWAILL